jgi:hypothetical protein
MDAPSSKNALSFSHAFGTCKPESPHFGLNLPIADTCQSLLMQEGSLE